MNRQEAGTLASKRAESEGCEIHVLSMHRLDGTRIKGVYLVGADTDIRLLLTDSYDVVWTARPSTGIHPYISHYTYLHGKPQDEHKPTWEAVKRARQCAAIYVCELQRNR